MTRHAVALVAVMVLACSKKPDNSIAQIAEIVAVVERSDDGVRFAPAQVGDKLLLGAIVRTGAQSRAKLSLREGGVLALEANATIRFADTPGQPTGDLRVEAGEVELEAGSANIAIGEAILEGGGKAKLSAVGDQGLKINVKVGKVVIEQDGQKTSVNAGQEVTITVKIGRVVLDDTPIKIDAGVAKVVADAAVTVDAAEPDAAVAEGVSVKVIGKPIKERTGTGMRTLPPGEHVVPAGSAIVAVAGSKVEITGKGGRAVMVGAGEVSVGGAHLVGIASGEVVLTGDGSDASAETPGGVAGARPSSEMRVQVRGLKTEIEVKQGEGFVRTGDGEETITVGDRVLLSDTGKLQSLSRAPTKVAFSVPTGESAVIHDPRAPTPVAVRFGGCPTGIVEVAKDAGFKRVLARTGGKTSGNVLLSPGKQLVRVTCGKAVVASLTVVRDTAKQPLPKVAPRTLVEADGREYVISYQNLLPQLTLAWREAPAGRSSYQFVIQPAQGAARRLSSPTPRLALKAGELAEGSYRMWVEIPETGGRSDEAKIVIDFDNAQPTVSFEKVEVNDGKVTVKGTVIEKTSVAAGGVPIALDSKLRFQTTLAPQPGETGVAIRIAHPKLGIHYYVVGSGLK